MTNTETSAAYLTVAGALFADNTLVLSPGFQTALPHYGTERPKSPLLCEQLAANGTVLQAWPLSITFLCAMGGTTGARAVFGKVPFHEQTRAMRYVLDGREILKVEVPRSHPVVRLTWTPGDVVEGRQKIAWEGSHQGGASLHYVVLYSPDGDWWQPLSLPLSQSAIDVDFSQLPGGRARIAVLASDGVNTTRVDSKTFRVAIKPCLATVLAPVRDTPNFPGRPVLLVGQGYYMEERRPELEALSWSSSLDGELGSGRMIECRLSPGKHTITLTAGSGARAGTATTSVLVEPPEVRAVDRRPRG